MSNMIAVVLVASAVMAGMVVAEPEKKAAGDVTADPKGVLLKLIPAKIVVLTFDDTCMSHLTFVGPLLKKYGFGGTFYVTEAFTDKKMYMSWEQIKELQDMGFEIGNHSTRHGVFSNMSVEDGIKELMGLDEHCVANKVAKPTTFCWPVYAVNKGLFPTMIANGYMFARGGGERPYVPTVDCPFNAPSFTVHDGTLKKKDSFFNAVKQATPGKMSIFCFHGAPDPEHPWVNTSPAAFEECMKYLKDNNYTVIAMRDIAKYVDAAKAAKELAR
ncbi:MAG: polysaccharide deacetylase family protein [bacterium]